MFFVVCGFWSERDAEDLFYLRNILQNLIPIAIALRQLFHVFLIKIPSCLDDVIFNIHIIARHTHTFFLSALRERLTCADEFRGNTKRVECRSEVDGAREGERVTRIVAPSAVQCRLPFEASAPIVLERVMPTYSPYADIWARQEEFDLALAEVRADTERWQRELDAEERALASDEALRKLIGDRWLALHISLLLGDSSPSWGLAVGGESDWHAQGDAAGYYVKILSSFNTAYEGLLAARRAPDGFVQTSEAEERAFNFVRASVDGGPTPSRPKVRRPITST